MGPSKSQNVLDYVEVCTLFSNAEAKIKKVEHLAGAVVIPSVNQLRYAGAHLVRILRGGCSDPNEELRLAANHCKRASFDACEAGLLYCLRDLAKFQDDYRRANILPVLPDWIKYCDCAKHAQNLVQISQDADRVKSYKDAESALDDLLKIVGQLPVARQELNKTIRRDRLLYGASVVAILVALGAWFRPMTPTPAKATPQQSLGAPAPADNVAPKALPDQKAPRVKKD